MGQDSLFNMPLTYGGSTKHVNHNKGRSAQHLRGGFDTILKSSRTNSISKDTLKDEDYL